MATPAELQAALEALKAVRRSGNLRVEVEGRSVMYRSDAEIQAAISAIEAELGGLSPRNVVCRSNKGWA